MNYVSFTEVFSIRDEGLTKFTSYMQVLQGAALSTSLAEKEQRNCDVLASDYSFRRIRVKNDKGIVKLWVVQQKPNEGSQLRNVLAVYSFRTQHAGAKDGDCFRCGPDVHLFQLRFAPCLEKLLSFEKRHSH